MRKNRNESSIAKERRMEIEVAALLRELGQRLREELETHMEHLAPAEDGEVEILTGGQKLKYSLGASPPPKVTALFLGTAFVQTLQTIRKKNKQRYLLSGMSFIAGLGSGVFVASEQIQDLQAQITKLTEHRVKGGRATKRLTPEQEVIAKSYVEDQKNPRVSFTTACNRAAAKLYKDHGIDVSGKTLTRLFPKDGEDNAERSLK